MSRALDFFLAPAPEPPTPRARVPRKQRTRAQARHAAPPISDPSGDPSYGEPAHSTLPSPSGPASGEPARAAVSPGGSAPSVAVPWPDEPVRGAVPPYGAPLPGLVAPSSVLLPGDPLTAPGGFAALRVVTGAAVLGRAREAEPVAAALALALRRETRSKAATVAVIGPPLPEGSGGSGAGRRLAARLEAEGLQPRVRGRLAWVRLDPADPELPALAWRLALVAAPVVFAVTAPRTAAIDATLADQDLVVLVTTDPESPLALAATAGLPRVATAAPLGRGLARELSRAGMRPATAIRRFVEPPRRNGR